MPSSTLYWLETVAICCSGFLQLPTVSVLRTISRAGMGWHGLVGWHGLALTVTYATVAPSWIRKFARWTLKGFGLADWHWACDRWFSAVDVGPQKSGADSTSVNDKIWQDDKCNIFLPHNVVFFEVSRTSQASFYPEFVIAWLIQIQPLDFCWYYRWRWPQRWAEIWENIGLYIIVIYIYIIYTHTCVCV